MSDKEKKFLQEKDPDRKTLIGFSWRIESALTLAWALNLCDKLHEVNRMATGDEMEVFFSSTPQLEGQTRTFLNNVSYRNLEEVYLENLVNEKATGYFRDLFVYGRKDETNINRMVSFERHETLNWVRQFSEIKDWDSTDTST